MRKLFFLLLPVAFFILYSSCNDEKKAGPDKKIKLTGVYDFKCAEGEDSSYCFQKKGLQIILIDTILQDTLKAFICCDSLPDMIKNFESLVATMELKPKSNITVRERNFSATAIVVDSTDEYEDFLIEITDTKLTVSASLPSLKYYKVVMIEMNRKEYQLFLKRWKDAYIACCI